MTYISREDGEGDCDGDQHAAEDAFQRNISIWEQGEECDGEIEHEITANKKSSGMYSRIPRLVNFMSEWRVEQEAVDDTVREREDCHDDDLGEMW